MNSEAKRTILCVDDDKRNLELLEAFLSPREYTLKFSRSGADAMAQVEAEIPDLILLDVMLPDASGFEICKRLKDNEKFSSIPVLMLSAKKEESDKVFGLDIGADDYIVKPFSGKELNSRIKAVLRRSRGEAGEEQISAGGALMIDPQRHEVTVLGKKIPLTVVEFTLVQLLASGKGHVFSRGRILEHLWGSSVGVTERTIDVHVTHLREKLGEAGGLIKSVRGVGYKMDDSVKDE